MPMLPCSEYGVFRCGSMNCRLAAETAAAGGLRGQGVGEYRAGGQLRSGGAVQGNGGLVDAVAGGEQVVDGAALEAGVEHAVAGLQHGLIVQPVGEAQARRKVLRAGRHLAGQRVIVIADRGLRQDAPFRSARPY